MTQNEMEKFEKFLTDSFGDGMYFRELRLSYEEVEYLKKRYPKASIKKSSSVESLDGKLWWEIDLLASDNNQNKIVEFREKEIAAI